MLPARSPNLNAFAERWVRSVKEECLSRLIFFGEQSLRRALTEYIEHFHRERNHQGKGNKLLFPEPRGQVEGCRGTVECKKRLGGLLRYYEDYYFDRTPSKYPVLIQRGCPIRPNGHSQFLRPVR